MYLVTQKLPQIYTANHATFPIGIRKITVQICGNFWVTQNIERMNEVADKNSDPLINGVVDPGGVNPDPTFDKKCSRSEHRKKPNPS